MDEPVFVLAPEVHVPIARSLRLHAPGSDPATNEAQVTHGIRDSTNRLAALPHLAEALGKPALAEGLRFEDVRVVTMRLLWDCNLRCIMCDHPHRPRSEMPVEMAHKVLDQLTHPVRLTFIGGEPCLWLLKHPEVLRRAFADGHVVQLTTNAILVPRLPEFVDAFYDRPVIAQISIDGYGATYERIRKRSNWEDLVASIRLLHSRRTKGSNKRARIGATYLLMRSTLADLPRFIRFCSEEGIDSVWLIYTMIYDSMVRRGEITEDESVYHYKEETNEAVRQAAEVAREVGVSLACPRPLGEPSGSGIQWVGPSLPDLTPGKHKTSTSKLACAAPFKDLFIYQDGTIRPCCCGAFGPTVGHIDDGLLTAWNSDEIEEVRQALTQGRMHQNCQCGINISSVARQEGEEHFFTRVRNQQLKTIPVSTSAKVGSQL